LGKSLCLLSVLVAFQKQFKPETQVFFATRTLLDMQRVTAELKLVQ
jgi:hypothetical protein